MTAFDDLLQSETLASVRAQIKAFAEAAELKVTDWIAGGTGHQIFEAVSATTFAFTSVVTRTIRGFASLDTSTDPGDVDAFDAGNVNLEPEAGFLSNLGANNYGTIRGGKTFATGFITFANNGSQSRTFAPYALTHTWTVNPPAGTAPTYRNAPDDSIYTNPDGTVTVAAGATLVCPIIADEIGSRSNAPPSSLSLTTTLIGCSATNAAAILGSDREDAETYRGRCRQAPDRVSLAGPGGAYGYFAAKNLDGTPLKNASGDEVNITRTWNNESSTNGTVSVYFASPSGAAISDDVTAANANIQKECFAVPGAINYSGVAATETSVHVSGTVKVRGSGDASIVKQKIVDALLAYLKTIPIGGFDQVSGAGFVYTEDLVGIIRTAVPNIYDPHISTPFTSTTALALGHVATLNSNTTSDWFVTFVP